MLRPEIEEFGKVLINLVRDKSVEGCDMGLRPDSNAPVAKRWRDGLKGGSARDLALTMIPDCVDETLCNLLRAIDEGVLRVSFVAGNGNEVDLASDGGGELAGWYLMSREGWRAKYSQQRFIDDFDDSWELGRELGDEE